MRIRNYADNKCLNNYPHMNEETFRSYKFNYGYSYSDSLLIDSFEKVIEYNSLSADTVDSAQETIQNILQNEDYKRLRNSQRQSTPIFVTIFSTQSLLNKKGYNFFIIVSHGQNDHSDNSLSYLFSLKKMNGVWALKMRQYY
jgi:hypothetical protein